MKSQKIRLVYIFLLKKFKKIKLKRGDNLNDLVYLNNNEAVCDSLLVAEKFGKRHADVLEKIEKIITDEPTENSVRCFRKSFYRDGKGEMRPMYHMNRD